MNLADAYRSPHILLVEDDEAIADVVVLALEDQFVCQVSHLRNAEEALVHLEDIVPHLLLLDYQLPKMNGVHLYDSIHQISEYASLPALILSANLPLQELQQRHLSGLAKPFSLDVLLTMVEQIGHLVLR